VLPLIGGVGVVYDVPVAVAVNVPGTSVHLKSSS
jgi:hypothetical protein